MLCWAIDAACPAASSMRLDSDSLHCAGIMVSGCFSPEGGLWMWGANTNSQLGKGDEEEDELVPLKVLGLQLMVFLGLGSLSPLASVLRTYAATAASNAVRQLAAAATAQAAHARQQLHMSSPMPQECLLLAGCNHPSAQPHASTPLPFNHKPSPPCRCARPSAFRTARSSSWRLAASGW